MLGLGRQSITANGKALCSRICDTLMRLRFSFTVVDGSDLGIGLPTLMEAAGVGRWVCGAACSCEINCAE